MITHSKCSKCGETKPSDEFYSNKMFKDGCNSYCKVCDIKYKKQRDGEKRHKIDVYKENNGCTCCGEQRPYLLVFHHRDPSQKKFGIGSSMQRSIRSIWQEIEKCDVYCFNCHMELHHQLRSASASICTNSCINVGC